MCGATRDVRFGSKADVCSAATHVRFAPNSDTGCVFSDVGYVPIADIDNGVASPVNKLKALHLDFCFTLKADMVRQVRNVREVP